MLIVFIHDINRRYIKCCLCSDQGQQCPAGERVTHFDPENENVLSPWDGLTVSEVREIQIYLQQDGTLGIPPVPDFSHVNSTYIYTMDVWMPPKEDVLSYLDNNGAQPERHARVTVYRLVS